MSINQRMNYANTYYNLYKKKYSSAPPQFKEQENYIMRFSTKLPYYAYSGDSLTIIYFHTGRGNLIVDGKKLKVSNQKFIILNPSSRWEYLNPDGKDIDVLSFVLSQQLLSKQSFFARANCQQLLHTPFELEHSNTFFFEQRFDMSFYNSGKLLNSIHNLSNTNGPLCIDPEGISMELLESITKDKCRFYEQSKKIIAIKTSTRIEVMKRLLVAFEYIHDNVTKNISIKELSIISCLSEFHLYNSFKNVFGSTPHQYINAQKMMKAREMLQKKSVTVSEVSTILNFPDLPTFSKLFKKTFGKAPSHFTG